jgi:hypothetical protein
MQTSLPQRHPPAPTLQTLSPERQRLVLLFQRIGFGRIFRVTVIGGQPVVRHLRWKRTVRVPGNNQPHPAAGRSDFPLKKEILDFFVELAALGDAEVTDVEVWDGLPRSFSVEESLED